MGNKLNVETSVCATPIIIVGDFIKRLILLYSNIATHWLWVYRQCLVILVQIEVEIDWVAKPTMELILILLTTIL